jgi:RimJ/RimL family protein N-acetyltransferase
MSIPSHLHPLIFSTFFLTILYLTSPHLYPHHTRRNQNQKPKPTSQPYKKELQKLTASEPLSLTEEYSMQRSWRQDPDKLTFIACLPPSPTSTTITPGKDDAPSQMLGDINLFLVDDDSSSSSSDDDEDKDNNDGKSNDKTASILGEIELMIALPSNHRKGYGRAALLAFLHYTLTNTSAILTDYSKGKETHLTHLRVKISEENKKSIALFESVGFIRTSAEANYFGEVELRLQVLGNESILIDLGKVRGWSGEVRSLGYGG